MMHDDLVAGHETAAGPIVDTEDRILAQALVSRPSSLLLFLENPLPSSIPTLLDPFLQLDRSWDTV